MKLFRRRYLKILSLFLAINILYSVFFPTIAFALTGGPSQPEVQGFAPIGTSDMVDIFTGDYSYNIPLLDVGGYPINISYASGQTMDQEASWVGLGWSLNPGVINRSVRGVPDDFKGDKITRNFNMKEQFGYGINLGVGVEILGLDKNLIGLDLSASLGLGYNNYDGYSFEFGINPSINASTSSKSKMTLSLGLSANSATGVGITPALSFSDKKDKNKKSDSFNASIGLPYNSREGVKALSISASYTKNVEKTNTRTKKDGSTVTKSKSSKEKMSIGKTFSFATPTYMHRTDMASMNTNISFGATLGTEIFGLHGNISLGGYLSKQFQYETTKETNSFGYLYEHLADRASLVDYNREKDGAYTPNQPSLPVTNHTFDVFSVSAQGIGGLYRPCRNDIGIVYDPSFENIGNGSVDVSGIEIGAGNGAHGGANVLVSISSSKSGKWAEDNRTNFGFANNSTGLSEAVYFKQAGERIADKENSLYESIGENKAVRIKVSASQVKEGRAENVLEGEGVTTIPTPNYKRTKRAGRNQEISILSASEASMFGLEHQIENFPQNSYSLSGSGDLTTSTKIDRVGSYRKSHHISQISALRPDGTRYVFGIPAYNVTQKEQTFAIGSGSSIDHSIAMVDYNTSFNNLVDNENGSDHYFDQTITPAYAHSYLLTSVLSADYVDVDGNGPSINDLGSYTKINYSLTNNNYKWRVPFGEQTANYSEGLKLWDNNSELSDDKANFLYGEKEIWFTHSIETKTHVAIFYTSPRSDGNGVAGIDGGFLSSDVADKSMQKLDKIELYTRQELMTNSSNPTPIKTVHFEYDYSLCPDIDNNINGEGKLTLRKIYFTYQGSNKGKFNAYEFTYTNNASYNAKGYDRWGNYKYNAAADNSTALSPAEYPYVEQDKVTADLNASKWSLSTINMPSGGKIVIDYESDDYAYVQDKNAMQMFKVKGAGSSSDYVANNTLYSSGSHSPNQYLYFELQEPLNSENFEYDDNNELVQKLNQYISQRYFKNIEHLYFKFLLDIGHNNASEFVPGYVKPEQVGVCTNNVTGGIYTHGYLKLQSVGVEHDEEGDAVNPISKAGWGFLRKYHPRVAYGRSDGPAEGSALKEILKEIAAAFKGIGQMFTGINGSMQNRNLCREFAIDKSWIRLYNPTGFKYGGGSRVKQVRISDEWDRLAGTLNARATYGQEYDYTITEADEYGNLRTISSGVASYEPILGNDENPFRQPIFITEDKLLAPSEHSYVEEPFGESFFPSASVGYRKVTVKNIIPEDEKGSGKVVHDYYTAKDFPTITSRTSTKNIRTKPTNVGSLLDLHNIDYMVASQGFVVELNDMHGKEKGQSVYQEGKDEPISTVYYKYKQATHSGSTETNVLSNNADVLFKEDATTGKITSTRTLGVDYDVIADMRQSQTSTYAAGLNGNLDAFLAAIFPMIIPTIFPTLSDEQTSYRSATVTKVINRYSLLEETIATDLGSSVSTSNLLYDGETGEVLLTKTVNQFEDTVYSFTYPAHWGYDQMGLAYKNVGYTTSASQFASISNYKTYYSEGDELALISPTGGNIGWVTNVSTSGITVIDRNGSTISPTDYLIIKVIRSGRRNMQTAPIGNITCMSNPITKIGSEKYLTFADFENILDASAVVYDDNVKLYCADGYIPNSGTYNPYIKGEKGNWRPNMSYVYLTERTQTDERNNTNVRKDGIYSRFSPFWMPSTIAGNDFTINDNNWQFTSEITNRSPYGFELENRDALGRYSAALYGYQNTLPTAVANNAKYKEIAFDGFEDYGVGVNADEHFNFKNEANATLTTEESHSGRRSIEVSKNDPVEIVKVIDACD